MQQTLEMESIKGFEDYENLKTEIQKKYSKKRTEIDNAEAEAKEVTEQMKLNSASNAIGAIAAVAGEHKLLSIAAATIDTYSAVTGALADKTTPSSTLRFINAAAMGVMGLANVMKIMSTDVGSDDMTSSQDKLSSIRRRATI